MENINAVEIAVLKGRVDNHDEKFDIHEGLITSQANILSKISTTLMQIKWLAIGAFAYWVVDNLGFVESVKTIFNIT